LTLRILFAGVPHFAHALLDAGCMLTGVILPVLNDDDECFSLMARCHEARIPIWPSRALSRDATPEDRAALEKAGPHDLLLVMNFHRLVPDWGIALARRDAWNVHPSLLPRHRGYNPYYWAIRSGDDVTGVTVHRITGAFDAGDILAQAKVPILFAWTSGHLWQALNEASLPLLLPLLKTLESGKKVPGKRQLIKSMTHDPKPTDAELTVDVTQPVDEVLRHIRAATPEPGLFLDLEGRTYLVRGAAAGPPPPTGLLPGAVFLADGRACVVVKDGSVRPFTVETLAGVVDLARLVSG